MVISQKHISVQKYLQIIDGYVFHFFIHVFHSTYMFFIQGLEGFSSSKVQEGTLQTPVWCLAHIPDKEA